MLLPPPPSLGLHLFPRWRPQQSEAVLRAVDSDKRFVCLVQPVGFGKSLAVAAVLKLLRTPSVVMTSTNQLLGQYGDDFSYMEEIKGAGNYECLVDSSGATTCDDGPCHAGLSCELRKSGCIYYDKIRVAHSTRVARTNYSFWMSHNAYGEGFTDIPPRTLVLDEAHAAPDELAEFLSVRVTPAEVKDYLSGHAPPLKGFRAWAEARQRDLESELADIRVNESDRAAQEAVRRMKNISRRLIRLATSVERGWVGEETRDYKGKLSGWRFDPVDPAMYAEQYLFRGAPKVILVSATIREKTLQLLGLKPKDYDFREYQSSFPIDRRPFIYIRGSTRLTFRAAPAHYKIWLSRIDRIIDGRLDRKGVIHVPSYKMRNYIRDNSRHRSLFMTHESGSALQQLALARFRAAEAPAIFLSPSAHTGIDLPYQQCEYQIIAKVPFPDMRSRILKARARKDKQYFLYLTMLKIVQASGRGMRAVDDRCETLMVEGSWEWFGHRNKKFAPKWFWASVRQVKGIPDPPPLLATERKPRTRVVSTLDK